jgi:hypothetical protein
MCVVVVGEDVGDAMEKDAEGLDGSSLVAGVDESQGGGGVDVDSYSWGALVVVDGDSRIIDH